MRPVRESVKVQVMGKEFAVACNAEEKTTLLSATRFLNEQIDEIQSHGKIVGNDRIAIMVAINLASELLETREQQEASKSIAQDIEKLSARIDSAMKSDEN